METDLRDVLVRTRPLDGVVQLTLNRPEQLNALDESLFASLRSAIEEIAGDATCRAVVLTGAGRGFCAGADMTLFAGLLDSDARAFWDLQRDAVELVPRLCRLPQPVIAAVNGVAVGGGLSLTCASDIRIASESASFAAAGRRVGLSAADMGVGWLLPRLVGLARAQELMITGRRFTAAEALDSGLLARVVPADELLDTALEIAGTIASGPPFATSVTKEALWNSMEVPSLQAMMDLENRHQAMLIQGPEHREAVTAFLEMA